MFFVLNSSAFASLFDDSENYDLGRDYQCSQLIYKIQMQKNTLYNVLNLSPTQAQLKDEIEARRHAEMQPYIEDFMTEQEKLRELAKTNYDKQEFKAQYRATNKAWRKLHRGMKKYDKELMAILCSTQRAKYKEIRRMVKHDVRYCYLNKKSCPANPYINTFGKNDAKPLYDVCPKHNTVHLLNRKDKTN